MDLTTREGRKEQGQRIQQAAQALGLTLEELASEIGCSRALIYQYASGGVLAQSARLQKIAQRTGRSLAYFFEDLPAARSEDSVDESGEPIHLLPAEGSSRSDIKLIAGDMPRMDSPPDSPTHRDSSIDVVPNWRTGSRESVSETTGPTNELQPAPGSVVTARIALPYLEELADSMEASGDAQGLVSACERIVPFARELGDREAEARAWLRIGNARVERDYHDLALPALRVALGIFGELGNDRLVLSCRQSIGRALLALGDCDGAMTEFERVARGPTWTNRWQGVISMAAVSEQAGDFRSALEHCEEAMRIVTSTPGVFPNLVESARSYVYSNQANVYLACGDLANTERISQELLFTSEKANQRDQFVEALIDLGVCQLYQGKWNLSEENLVRAIEVARFMDDRPRWGLARAWKASLLSRIGNGELAKAEAKSALQTGLKSSSRRCEIQGQISAGEAYLSTGSPGEALYHLEEAVQSAAESSSVVQYSSALLLRGAARLALHEIEAAANDIRAALTIAQERGIEHIEAMSREQMGRIELSNNRLSESLEMAASAERIAHRLGLLETELRSQALVALVNDLQEQPDEAALKGDSAIRIVLELRARVLEKHEDEALLDDPAIQEIVQQQVLRLARSGQPEAAQILLEEVHWPPLWQWFQNLPGASLETT